MADTDSPARSTRGHARRQLAGATTEHVVAMVAASADTTNKRGPGRPSKGSLTNTGAVVAAPPIPTRRSSSNAPSGVATHLDAGNMQDLQLVTASLDKLKAVPFPKRGYPYNAKAWLQAHKQDLNDSLLMLCAKACAMCGNRALAPKEFVLVLTRRFGWVYQGNQPFALVSNCLRDSLKRAAVINAHPLFLTYELGPITSQGQLAALGIDPAAKPIVKRGTLWYLNPITTGFPSAFPEHAQAPLAVPLPPQHPLHTRSNSSTMHNAAASSAVEAVMPTVTAAVVQPIKPPVSPTRNTRAHPAPVPMPEADQTSVNAPPQMIVLADPSSQSLALRASSNKRKRMASTSVLPSPATLGLSPPPVDSKPTLATAAAPSIPATGHMPLRRALSMSTPETGLVKPLGLRKLKLRLPALPEDASASAVSPAAALRQPGQTGPGRPPKRVNPHQTKRQRTQSMSSLVTVPAVSAFPFDEPLQNILQPMDMHNTLINPSSEHELLGGESKEAMLSRSAPLISVIAGPFSRKFSMPYLSSRQMLANLTMDTTMSENALQEDDDDGDDEVGVDEDTDEAIEMAFSPDESYHLQQQQDQLGASQDFSSTPIDFSFDSNVDTSTSMLHDISEEGPNGLASFQQSTSQRSRRYSHGMISNRDTENDDVDALLLAGLTMHDHQHARAAKASQDAQDVHLTMQKALLEGETAKEAFDTTLCPATIARPLTTALNSSSSLSQLRTSAQRPGLLSRNPSRDVLAIPVPLADLPSLAPAADMHHPILLYDTSDSVDAEDSFASEIPQRSDRGSSLSPLVKSEDELDGLVDLEVVRQRASRSLSSTPISADSTDDFDAHIVVPRTRSTTQENMEAEELRDKGVEAILQCATRSHTSSRTNSLSPRDSFSPQAVAGLPADWALTPPSEEEENICEEDGEMDKNLDRAVLLGPDSVGMDDLDDVWPGSRFHDGKSIDIVSSAMAEVGVFKPVLCLAQPQLQSNIPSCFAAKPEIEQLAAPTTEMAMQIDDEDSATKYIVDDIGPHVISQSVASITSAVDEVKPDSAVIALPTSTLSTTSLPASTRQSFLFHPKSPTDPPMSILLTDQKILFYSTPILVGSSGETQPLLRRVENDAVDALALLQSFEGRTELEAERLAAIANVRDCGNSWVGISFARELVRQFAPDSSSLERFLADDILLHWNDKLLRLGLMLRSKHNLPIINIPEQRQLGVGDMPTPRATASPALVNKSSKINKDRVKEKKQKTSFPIDNGNSRRSSRNKA